MDRKMLEENVAKARDGHHAAYAALTSKIKDVLENVLHSAKLDSIAKVRRVTDACAEIEVECPGHQWGHDFTLYFHDRYDGAPRKVEMNVGTFGSFSASDRPEVNFYVVAGKFASCLEEIQDCFNNIDFKEYHDAWHASYDADNALRKFDADAKKAEDDKRKAEIESKLIEGAKIKVGFDCWNNTDIVDTIINVARKNIYFRKAKPMSKEDVIRNFFKVNSPWVFIA